MEFRIVRKSVATGRVLKVVSLQKVRAPALADCVGEAMAAVVNEKPVYGRWRYSIECRYEGEGWQQYWTNEEMKGD